MVHSTAGATEAIPLTCALRIPLGVALCVVALCTCRYVAEQHVPPAARHTNARELLYGCQDGRLVQLLVDASTVRQGFVIQGSQGSRGGFRAAVTAIHCGADYSKVGLVV